MTDVPTVGSVPSASQRLLSLDALRGFDMFWIVGGPIKGAFGNYGELLVTSFALGMSFPLVRFLYQRKIFLRL